MLTTDDDIEVINVNSSASPHSHGDTPAKGSSQSKPLCEQAGPDFLNGRGVDYRWQCEADDNRRHFGGTGPRGCPGNSGGVTFNANQPEW